MPDFIQALLKETALQKEYLQNERVETIYFGGGTPSLLPIEDCQLLIDKLKKQFLVSDSAEVTLEANPDDITEEKLHGWKTAGINRLSIGVQSFFEEDLTWMNRAHNAKQAIGNLQLAIQQFDNITLDLIYGHPLLTHEKWGKNIEEVISLNIPHISCYALTIEPKTPLQKMIREKKKKDIDPEKQAEQFSTLMKRMSDAGYEHYEISNFAKPGKRSQHNSSYWQGKKYLGLGPSAHSFDGISRQWNVSNNNLYTAALSKNEIPYEKEILTASQKLNEYIMTSLRTIEGLDLLKIDTNESRRLKIAAEKFIKSGKLILKDERLVLTNEGKLLADGIAAELFADQ